MQEEDETVVEVVVVVVVVLRTYLGTVQWCRSSGAEVQWYRLRAGEKSALLVATAEGSLGASTTCTAAGGRRYLGSQGADAAR